MQIILEASTTEVLRELRREYLASLSAPLDGMWEAFGKMGRHLAIRAADQRVGYVVLNDEGQLLQFHLAEPFVGAATELFTAVLARDEVQGVFASTADPLVLGQCLDAHSNIEVHTYLYQDHERLETTVAGDPETSFELVSESELVKFTQLQRASLDVDLGPWLETYLANLIARRELYAVRSAGEVLATGELRVSDSQPPFADLGVITMQPHRGRGVASHVLRGLKQLCYQRNLVPICSTTVANVASQRAIAKAGFVSRHRILAVEFG